MIFKRSTMLMRDWYLINNNIKDVLGIIDSLSMFIRGKPIVITSLLRPPAIKKSYHVVGCAADIRTKDMTDSEINMIETVLFFIRDNVDNKLGVEPHEELKGEPQQHLHIEYEEDGVEPE